MEQQRGKPFGRGLVTVGGPIQIAVMGALLGAALFVVWFVQPSGHGEGDPGNTALRIAGAPAPELDPEILARVRDTERRERLLNPDSTALAHLLKKSLNVVPATAQQLGMPKLPIPIARLRNNPGAYRGNYIWYKGRLEHLSKPKPGHPVPEYKIYEARIRTEDDQEVLFTFSVKPPDGLVPGKSWVRAEGFFMKLRDNHFPPLHRAPLLVGPELIADYPDWRAVEKLDPVVLARVDDGRWERSTGPLGDFSPGRDLTRTLIASQLDVPLWHLASFAIERDETDDPAPWRERPAFTTAEQLNGFRDGTLARGTPMRILGTFVESRTFEAKANPLDIGHWTEAQIQVRDLGGKVIPVWLPRDVSAEGKWLRNTPVEVRGYYYKNYRYTARDSSVRWTPLFVAARLDSFEIDYNPNTALTWGFAGIAGLALLVFVVMTWRDRRQSQRHEAAMVERRRRRRDRATASAVSG